RNLRILTLITNDLIYIIILVMLFIKDIKFGLKDLKNNFSIRALLSVKCWVIGCLIMTISSLLISILIKQNLSTNEELVRKQITLAPFYMLFACSIVAPIIEEMVFRKSLSGLIKCKWLFILVSGLGFGLLHVISSYSNPLEFLYIIPYGSMGCAFAYLLTKTNNITLPIIIHMIHNTVLVLSQIYGG
ncbi:MAG: CPBP family intramembrane glutamic endopeptidase, partial [Bacilli bacterium]